MFVRVSVHPCVFVLAGMCMCVLVRVELCMFVRVSVHPCVFVCVCECMPVSLHVGVGVYERDEGGEEMRSRMQRQKRKAKTRSFD